MNQYQTIIHKEHEKTEIYHGILLNTYEKGFTFGFRQNGKNYIWECDNTYWTLK